MKEWKRGTGDGTGVSVRLSEGSVMEHFLSGETTFCHNIDCFSALIEAGLHGWMVDYWRREGECTQHTPFSYNLGYF